MRRACWMLVGAIACEAEPAPVEVVHEEPWTQLVRSLDFGVIEAGVSPGFDLDGEVTDEGDDAGCGLADFTSPDGAPGVDNSFGAFLPILASVGGLALYELVQEAVDNGEILITLTVGEEGADGCIPVEVGRATGVPTIGGDGMILPNQTFDKHAEDRPSVDTCARWVDGALSVHAEYIRLTFGVFDESLDLTIHDARFNLVPDGTGAFSGAMAGGLDLVNIQDNVNGLDAIPEAIYTVVDTVLADRADLRSAPESTCDRVSAVLVFESVPSFWFE